MGAHIEKKYILKRGDTFVKECSLFCLKQDPLTQLCSKYLTWLQRIYLKEKEMQQEVCLMLLNDKGQMNVAPDVYMQVHDNILKKM